MSQGTSKFLISQNNPIKIVWDLFILLELIFISILVPYRIAYANVESKGWTTAYYFIDICFGIDIILTFNTSYINHGSFHEVNDRKLIIMNYLQGWFFLDVLAIVPFDRLVGAE